MLTRLSLHAGFSERIQVCFGWTLVTLWLPGTATGQEFLGVLPSA